MKESVIKAICTLLGTWGRLLRLRCLVTMRLSEFHIKRSQLFVYYLYYISAHRLLVTLHPYRNILLQRMHSLRWQATYQAGWGCDNQNICIGHGRGSSQKFVNSLFSTEGTGCWCWICNINILCPRWLLGIGFKLMSTKETNKDV